MSRVILPKWPCSRSATYYVLLNLILDKQVGNHKLTYTHTIHGTGIFTYIYLILRVNVGTYTIPSMGKVNEQSSRCDDCVFAYCPHHFLEGFNLSLKKKKITFGFPDVTCNLGG